MTYIHTQNGLLIKVCVLSSIVLTIVVISLNGWVSPVAFTLYGVTLVMLILLWLFGSLMVQVSAEELLHYFGPGFWRKTYLLLDITSAKKVRNSWIYGWGIRLTPHGWLYNVSGLDAVEVELRSGRKLRIGTDDPDGLIAALQPSS